MNLNLNIIRQDLLDKNKGYFVLRNFYSNSEVDQYRKLCMNIAKKGPVINRRINIKNMFDYAHKRSDDNIERTIRVYQFFENHKFGSTGEFLKKSKDLMDKIELEWSNQNETYKKYRETLQSYIIFTWYKPGFGRLPIHQDSKENLEYPLLQSNIMLTQHNKDYFGGDFIFYSKNNRRYSINEDLKLKKGDALFFDKSLYHEVTQVEQNSSNISRCSLLINARAKYKKEKLLIEKIKTNRIFNLFYSRINQEYKKQYN